jgi:hypothetical protein
LELLLEHKLLTTPVVNLLKYNAGYEPTKGTLGETVDWDFVTVALTQLSKHSSMKRAKVSSAAVVQVFYGHSLAPPLATL